MVVALNCWSTGTTNLLTDIRIAREAGYDTIEIESGKLRRYVARGLSLDRLVAEFASLPPVGIGAVWDIDRASPSNREALLAETESLCALAERLGIPAVQLLTGPVVPSAAGGWPVGADRAELRRVAAANLAAIGRVGIEHGVSFYIEPLAWTPLGPLDRALEVLDAAEQDNVGLVLDFWHLWNTGTTPEHISQLPRRLIHGVHVCDSLACPSSGPRPDQSGRAVWTGAGRIPLQEWADAVVATGYQGWWTPELFSPRHWELDPFETAKDLRQFLRYLLL